MRDLPAARISEISIISLIQMALMIKDYEKHSGKISKGKKILELKKY